VSVSDVDSESYRGMIGLFASGVAVVTGRDECRVGGFTCQSVFSLSLVPALIALTASRTSQTWPLIARTGNLCINILAARQRWIAVAFARTGTDKFADVEWEFSECSGSPKLKGAVACFDCSIEDTIEVGDHVLVIASPAHMSSSEGDPLIYYRGCFAGVAGL
jgi:3-hydroxy-9,10-secoandrosta-1,3,5(10)-triene-9,17-dione monooxygenase reductase component